MMDKRKIHAEKSEKRTVRYTGLANIVDDAFVIIFGIVLKSKDRKHS